MKFLSLEGLPPSTRVSDFEAFYTDDRWRALGDLIPDGLIIVDATGFVRYMNAAAESINEVYRQMVVGHSLEDFVQQSRLDYSVLLEVFEHGYARVNKTVFDDRGRAYLISTRSHYAWNGENVAFMIVLRDLEAQTRVANRASRASSETPGLHFAPPPVEAGRLPGAHAAADEGMLGGKGMMNLIERGLRAMTMNIRLLILGESGVGKTDLARLLHRRSGAATRPFVHVNCGSIPDSLWESEMFGYERGAFTGASSRGKKGLVEEADGGVLFLDEVGEIPLHCQAKMLQMLEGGFVQRVGSTTPRRLQVQIVAATNRDLRALVREGKFRADLYYRLAVVTLALPPLRERRDVIPALLERFLARINQRRATPLALDAGCRRRLSTYAWPGNVRELQNVIEYLGVTCDETAREADLPLEAVAALSTSPPETETATPLALAHATATTDLPTGFSLREAVRQYEITLIDAAIQQTGSKRKAAELLGVDIATVVRKSRSAA
ncbi:MAG: sigma 54-interacting transcriptional regulator [Zoogloeaceae bacterium]|jgi:PAS domain S-box-containing protein|nr:sigma 54-interacting transcriptional regulator [Zoogloeaceae bacterium]